jgi:enoyl-CoA hydratase/carnithine racemase
LPTRWTRRRDPSVGVCVISGNERFAAGADLNEMAEKICPPRSMIFARGCGRVSMLQ